MKADETPQSIEDAQKIIEKVSNLLYELFTTLAINLQANKLLKKIKKRDIMKLICYRRKDLRISDFAKVS